ncbi:MAG: polysaccharide biosynthesis tyrosine autokinase [Methylacidiphilales bacterium]|nr:polysaccharide biosynthesis tyrosine autokinase [Candidatus Methylacidiphilales bacterium]
MPESPEVSLHFSDYWRVIKNRWPIIATVFVLVVATTYFYTRSLSKIYSASAVIKVERENKDVSIFKQEMQGFDPVFFQTEYELIQSKKVLYPVIDKMGLQDVLAKQLGLEHMERDQVYFLLRNNFLKVQPYRNTNLIEIAVESQDAGQAADLANVITRQYQEYRIQDINEKSSKGLQTIREELDKQKKTVQEASAKVEKIRKDKNIDEEASSGADATTSQEMELQRKEALLTEAKADALGRQVRYDKVKNMSIEELETVLRSIGIEDSTISTLEQNFLSTQQNIEYLAKQGYESDHPKVKSAVASLDKIRSQLNQQIAGIKTGLEIDCQVANSKVKSIEDDVTAMRNKNRAKKSDDMVQFEEAKRELTTQQSLLDVLMGRFKQESFDSQIGSRPVIIVNEAEVNREAIRPRMSLNIALAVAVGLVLGISLAFFIEYLDTSVKSLDDVERYLNATVVGVIPNGVNTLNLEGPDSPNAEAYRILRAKLDLKAKPDGATTVTIVSGGPGEGKTTTLFNLAYVCAYSGINTLIVDTDFRRHSINTLLGVENGQGLADFLLGYLPLHECIKSTEIPNLQIITAGKLPPQCMGALSPAKMSEIIAVLKPHYDVIMFDSPPILGISDAAVIVHEVDMTLLAIQHRRYPRNISWRAKKVIEEVQGRFAGVVLNKVLLRSDESYYYYTSYYGYHGYYDEDSRQEAKDRAKTNKQKMRKQFAKNTDKNRPNTPSSKQDGDLY